MKTSIKVTFINSVNQQILDTIDCEDAQTANLIIPSDGYISLNKNNYKVTQIIKHILNSNGSNMWITVYVYVSKITNNDLWYLK